MNRFLFIFLVLISNFILSQTDEVFSKVESKINDLSPIYGELAKDEKSYFMDIVVSAFNNLEADFKLDHNKRFENYLTKVFNQIIPDSKEKHKISLFKSSYPNATCMFLGNIQFHWGLLAEFENEASLAFIMGHEYAHYAKAHLYQEYMLRDINKESDRESVIKYYHKSQNDEYESDSLGFVFGVKAGYNWKSAITQFNEFLSLDTVFKIMKAKNDEVYNSEGIKIDQSKDKEVKNIFVTHPPTELRIKKWKEYGAKWNKKVVNYLVSKEEFLALRSYAREKSLELFLKTQDYKIGLIKAFKYYSLEPENPVFHYYLYEFLRRKISDEKNIEKETFLSDVFILGQKKGVYKNLGWLFNNQKQLTHVSKNVVSKILQIGDTYEDLMSYLENQRGINLYKEHYLSKAIYYQRNDSLKTLFLNKYLSFKNIDYPDYAKALKESELSFLLKKQTTRIIVVNSISRNYISESGIGTNPIKSYEKYKKSVKKIDELLEKKLSDNTKIVFKGTDDIDFEEFNTILENFVKVELSKVYYGSVNQGGFIDNSSNLLKYPEIWTYFFKNKISEVNIIDFYDYEDRTVTHLENLGTKLKMAIRELHPILGVIPINEEKIRRKYVISNSRLTGANCVSSQKIIEAYSLLTNNLLITEIIQVLK